MNYPKLTACALGAVSIVFLASCAGGGSSAGSALPVTGAATNQGVASPDAANKKTVAFAYISDAIANSVSVFGSDGTLQRRIVRGMNEPTGLFVDSKQNLWVANAGAGNVLEFAPRTNKPMRTLADPGNEPTDVTICKNGEIYVAGATSIEVYSGSSSTATRSLTFPQAQEISAVTCDAKGNVFATGVVYFHSAVLEFPHGLRLKAKSLPFTGAPGSIKADAAGNLLIGDQSAGTITEVTEAGAPTGLSIATTSGAQCLSFGVGSDGSVGCPIYIPYNTGTAMGTSYTFPHSKVKVTFTTTFVAQPYGFAFAS